MTIMARPKTPRFHNEIKLEDYLYPDNKGRDGHWRYKRPDNTFKHFNAKDVHQANAIARHNNERRDSFTPNMGPKKITGTLAYYLPQFITYRESHSPDLLQKSSWEKRRYALNQFCNVITTPIAHINRKEIQDWWDTLTNHQQKQRHAELRKFFNYLMGRELLPKLEYNPFTLSDDRPRLYTKSKPPRKSQRLTREGFWKIYASADKLGYTGLQIAMGVSLLTFMREGDICSLRISEHIEDNLLQKVIGKSESQKGSAKASRLKWDLQNYNLLKQLIKKGRELSLINRRCPFLISHWPKQKRLGNSKEHMAQITTRRLIAMFDHARRDAGFTGDNPPVFHGIRSLADKIALDAGYDIKAVQHAMSHSSEEMTKLYLQDHPLPFEKVDIEFTEEQIGGTF
ncbi:MAG: tyrosine-type recombinase/integrase [Pseudomonadales bacterium]